MVRSIVVALGLMALAASAMTQDARPKAYQFKRPPLAIYDALADLKAGDVPVLPDEERKLLETVWQWRTERKSAADSRPDQAAVLEAMLWASGIEDPAARDKYRQQFEKVVAAAKSAAKDAKNDRERGERLMKLLHEGVMKKGYSLDQTSFAAVFDEGEYNCVSSTAMYLLTGERLGLALVPISIPGMPFVPGHAALDMLDGKARIQIEPTNPDGFDWLTKSKRPDVTIIGFVPDRKKGHETDALGIAASIYTNRGVALEQGGAAAASGGDSLRPGGPGSRSNRRNGDQQPAFGLRELGAGPLEGKEVCRGPAGAHAGQVGQSRFPRSG